jgi:Uncharacterized protein related to arylsulfate sulfotransferase involved in siderophore biosynthesis
MTHSVPLIETTRPRETLPGVDDVLKTIGTKELEPHFRAVGAGAERRGIRLERIYWDCLGRMAGHTGTSTADIVRRSALLVPENGNLASVLRIVAFKWVLNRLENQEERAALESLNAIVHASPVPTLVMTRERRIMLFNELFVSMLRSKFSIDNNSAMVWDLKFLIDTQIDDAIATLNAKRGAVIKTGFSVALNARSMRGKINIALAPTQQKNMLVGYVADF